MSGARRVWARLAAVVVLGVAVTWGLFRWIEERAWREVNAAWEAGVDEYREFYAEASYPRRLEWGPGRYRHSPDDRRWVEDNKDTVLASLRASAVYEEEGLLDEERSWMGLRWRKSLDIPLNRVPPRGGIQRHGVLLLEAERAWFHTSIRARASLIEKGDADPRWADALRSVFEGSGVEFEVYWRGE